MFLKRTRKSPALHEPHGARVSQALASLGACSQARTYVPRRTQACDAIAIVREGLPAFVARVHDEGHASVPAFVRDELDSFVGCGDFGRGFVRLECNSCAAELRVPFSCKGRGVCPSCMGRRMCETAGLLVDHRLPAA